MTAIILIITYMEADFSNGLLENICNYLTFPVPRSNTAAKEAAGVTLRRVCLLCSHNQLTNTSEE